MSSGVDTLTCHSAVLLRSAPPEIHTPGTAVRKEVRERHQHLLFDSRERGSRQLSIGADRQRPTPRGSTELNRSVDEVITLNRKGEGAVGLRRAGHDQPRLALVGPFMSDAQSGLVGALGDNIGDTPPNNQQRTWTRRPGPPGARSSRVSFNCVMRMAAELRPNENYDIQKLYMQD